jgi:hypothetical protein
MTTAVQAAGGYLAFYKNADRRWVAARDARGVFLVCATEALALSVARYRRRRIKLWS